MADGKFVAAMTIVGDKLMFGDLIAKMAKVDFSPIVRYLQREDKNHWTEGKALSELENFKAFLALCGIAKFPVVPTRDIDEVWHACILHTEFYMRLCNLLFGKYIHHRPSDGTTEAKQRGHLQFKQTAVLFKELSGLDAYPLVKHKAGDCYGDCNCSGDCKGTLAKKSAPCDADCAPMVQKAANCDVEADCDVGCHNGCQCSNYGRASANKATPPNYKCASKCAATVVGLAAKCQSGDCNGRPGGIIANASHVESRASCQSQL